MKKRKKKANAINSLWFFGDPKKDIDFLNHALGSDKYDNTDVSGSETCCTDASATGADAGGVGESMDNNFIETCDLEALSLIGNGFKLDEDFDELENDSHVKQVFENGEYLDDMYGYINGTLEDFEPRLLMDKVIKTGHSLHSNRIHNDMLYSFAVFFEAIIGPVDENTKYWFDLVSEDRDGNQERLVKYDLDTHLSADEAVERMNSYKDAILNNIVENKETPDADESVVLSEGFLNAPPNGCEFVELSCFTKE